MPTRKNKAKPPVPQKKQTKAELKKIAKEAVAGLENIMGKGKLTWGAFNFTGKPTSLKGGLKDLYIEGSNVMNLNFLLGSFRNTGVYLNLTEELVEDEVNNFIVSRGTGVRWDVITALDIAILYKEEKKEITDYLGKIIRPLKETWTIGKQLLKGQKLVPYFFRLPMDVDKDELLSYIYYLYYFGGIVEEDLKYWIDEIGDQVAINVNSNYVVKNFKNKKENGQGYFSASPIKGGFDPVYSYEKDYEKMVEDDATGEPEEREEIKQEEVKIPVEEETKKKQEPVVELKKVTGGIEKTLISGKATDYIDNSVVDQDKIMEEANKSLPSQSNVEQNIPAPITQVGELISVPQEDAIRFNPEAIPLQSNYEEMKGDDLSRMFNENSYNDMMSEFKLLAPPQKKLVGKYLYDDTGKKFMIKDGREVEWKKKATKGKRPRKTYKEMSAIEIMQKIRNRENRIVSIPNHFLDVRITILKSTLDEAPLKFRMFGLWCRVSCAGETELKVKVAGYYEMRCHNVSISHAPVNKVRMNYATVSTLLGKKYVPTAKLIKLLETKWNDYVPTVGTAIPKPGDDINKRNLETNVDTLSNLGLGQPLLQAYAMFYEALPNSTTGTTAILELLGVVETKVGGTLNPDKKDTLVKLLERVFSEIKKKSKSKVLQGDFKDELYSAFIKFLSVPGMFKGKLQQISVEYKPGARSKTKNIFAQEGLTANKL